MFRGDGIVSEDPSSAAELVDALRHELVRPRQVAADEGRDTERVDADRLARRESVLACEGERPLEPRHGHVGRIHRDAELAEELKCAPFATGGSDLRGDGAASLRECHAGIEAPAAKLDRRRCEQGLGAKRRPFRTAFERNGKAPLGLVEVDPSQPERQQRHAETESIVRLVLEQRVEGHPQVRGLPVESRRPVLSLGQGKRPLRVPAGQCVLLTGLDEGFTRVHAHRLQEAVAPSPVTVLDRDERLLGEARETVGDLGGVEAVLGADVLGCLELEASREDRKPAEEDLLVRLEQLVAPLERRSQRLLSSRRPMAAASEQAETVVEPLRDRRRAERSDAPCGQLERERQPIEPKADAGDVVRVLLVQHEAGRGGCGPVDEERYGLVFPELLERRRLLRDRECPATGHGRPPLLPRAAARDWSRRSSTAVRSAAAGRRGRSCPPARARSCPARAAVLAMTGTSMIASTRS